MRKNKILSGVLAAVMAAALIPAMPADEISAEDISIKSGGSFYTVPADKSEPVMEGGWTEPVYVNIQNEKVGEETVEKKYFDMTLTGINDEVSNFSWDNLAALGNFALEFTVTTERGIVFTESKVGTVVHDTDNSQIWIADTCEINDGVGQFIGVGSNFVQRDYDKGQFNIRFVLPESYYGIYPQGSTEKITISYAIYKAEEAEAKWNLRPSQGLSKISVGKDELLSGANVLTVNNVDFYSNLPISVTYKSTSGEKSVRGCRVSLSDIDFDNYQDIEIVGSQEKNVDYVPVAWTAFQTKALSVSKQFTEIDDNGKYNERAIIKIASPQVGVVDHVDVMFTYVDNDNVKHKQTITTKKCYAAFKVGSDTVGENNCMFVIVTLRNIPDSIVPLMKDNKPCGLDIEYKMFY